MAVSGPDPSVPASAIALPVSCQLLFQAGRCDAAMAVWQGGAGSRPDNPFQTIQVAGWLARRGRRQEAAALLAVVTDDTDILCRLGAAWLDLGEAERAAGVFARATALRPDLAVSRLGLAASAGMAGAKAWGMQEAELPPLLQTLLAGDPDGAVVETAIGQPPAGETDIGLYWWLGYRIAERMGHGFAARACARRAVLATPDNVEWVYRFAEICLRVNGVGYLAGVWTILPSVLAAAPLSRLVAAAIALNGDRVAEALVLVQSLAGEQESLAWATQAAAGYGLTMMARDNWIRDRLAAFMHTGRRRFTDPSQFSSAPATELRAQAADCLQKVIAYRGTAEAWNDLGHFHADLGETAEACRCFERALRLDPAQRNATINLPVLWLRERAAVDMPGYLRRTVFQAALPPSLARLCDGAVEGPSDAQEWRRGTVFSYAWRRHLADLLAGDGP